MLLCGWWLYVQSIVSRIVFPVGPKPVVRTSCVKVWWDDTYSIKITESTVVVPHSQLHFLYDLPIRRLLIMSCFVRIVVFSICGQVCKFWSNTLPRSPVINCSVREWTCALTNRLRHRFSDLKTEAIYSYETSVSIYKTHLMSQVTGQKNQQCRFAQCLLFNCTLKFLICTLVKLLFPVTCH